MYKPLVKRFKGSLDSPECVLLAGILTEEPNLLSLTFKTLNVN